MPSLQQLCKIGYGPLANRLLRPSRVEEPDTLAQSKVPALVLSGADFDADGYPTEVSASAESADAAELVYVSQRLIDSFGVSPSTLLYLAKGSQHRPCLPAFTSKLPLLTGSSFIRIEIKQPKKLLREYLFAQLRSPRTWRQLEVRQEGAFIKNINRAALADLEIDVPPADRQQAVVEFAQLHRRADNLRARLTQLHQEQLSALLDKDLL